MHRAQRSKATVELVLGQASQRVAHEIAGFWLLHGAVGDPTEVKRRIGDVLLVMRDPEQTLVAVTSVYPYPMSSPGRYLGLRAFVDPTWRSMPFMVLMFDSMMAALHEGATEPTGVVFCSDNRKLMGSGNRRWFERRGWHRFSGEGAEKDEWLMMVGPGHEWRRPTMSASR